jgi:hypothetical protein
VFHFIPLSFSLFLLSACHTLTNPSQLMHTWCVFAR